MEPIMSKQKSIEKIIWVSKVFPELVMTQRMLDLLHYRYSHVKNWQSLMIELETYLVRRSDKIPKDYKKFVLNCAKRRADDVLKGTRFPDGKINLKMFAGPETVVSRDESLSKDVSSSDNRSLRIKLGQLERGTPEYEATLAKLEQNKKSKSQPMSLGDVFNKIASINNRSDGRHE
jgi:hypothetical protein